MKSQSDTFPLCFDGTVLTVSGRMIIRLPQDVSQALPSRGQVAVHAMINEHRFQTVLEPDGDFGHWMSVDQTFPDASGATAGDVCTVKLELTSTWPEPQVPQDLQQALSASPQEIRERWQAITPMARWEWVRWISATKNSGTRARRVEVSISKLGSGKSRPCCFNLSACTDPQLSKGGKLVIDEVRCI